MQPLLTSTIAHRWLGERVRARQWLGLALGLVGVYLVLRDKATAGEATPLAWAAITIGLIGITVGTLYQKRFGGGIDWRPALLIQYTAAAALFGAGAFAFETRVVHWTPDFVLALLYLIVVLSLGAVWLYYFMIRHAAATRVVSLFYLTPPVTAANTPRNFPFDVHMDDVLTRHRLPFGTQVTPPGVQPSRHSGNRYHSDQPGTTGEFH